MNLEEHAREWAETRDSAERMCFASADKILQKEALAEVETAIDRFSALLEEAIEKVELPDSVADSYYCLRLVLLELQAELHMWIAIREERYHDAWDHLIEAQDAAHFGSSSCEMLTRMDNRLRMLECLERIMFPPQVFSSPGMIAKYKCSICDQPIIDCVHVKGRLYRGRLCYHIATEVLFREFSFVDIPADKRRRITSYAYDGTMIDKLTNGPVRSQ